MHLNGLYNFSKKMRQENIDGNVKKRIPNSVSWGGLQNVQTHGLTLEEFLETYSTNPERRKWYIQDMSIERACGDFWGTTLLDEVNISKYFASDYFQRIPSAILRGDTSQYSWPSLFIGSAGTESGLHRDSSATHFWMYLVSGVKKWRVFNRNDDVWIYERPQTHTSFEVNAFAPDFSGLPMLREAKGWRHCSSQVNSSSSHPKRPTQSRMLKMRSE